jgi:hypothetical protein
VTWRVPLCFAILLASPWTFRTEAANRLELTVIDEETGEPIPCRMHLKNAAGRAQKVGQWPFWHDHFVFPGKITLNLPRGQYTFELDHGPEWVDATGHFVINDGANDRHTVKLRRIANMKAAGWWSGDLHVHRPVKDIELLMQAEDLHVAPVMTWWNKKSEWTSRRPPAETVVRFDEDRIYEVMAGEDEREGGALLYFNLPRPLEIAKAEREYPSPMKFLLAARETPGVWVDVEKPFWWDMPVWVASGKIDSMGLANNHMCRDRMLDNEAWGKARDKKRFPSPRGNGFWSQEIYYHLLNCGLRIPPTAGSASGVLPNPVGYNRVYAFVGEELTYENWWEAVRAGRVTVTNGPLLRPVVEGKLPGHVFRAPAGSTLELTLNLTFSTREPISYLEIIKDGKVLRSVRLDELQQGGMLPALSFDRSGWFLMRAVTDAEKTFRFASTGPYYVEIGGEPTISRKSAQFFVDWVKERQGRIKLSDPEQKREVLEPHLAAQKFWEDLAARANAD